MADIVRLSPSGKLLGDLTEQIQVLDERTTVVESEVSELTGDVALLQAPPAPRFARLAVEADTVALYPFSDSLNDIGPGALHLSVSSGGARFADFLPGFRGAFLRLGDRYNGAQGSPLGLAGNLTVEFLFSYVPGTLSSTNRIVYYWNDTVGSSTNNGLWGVELVNSTQDFVWFSYSGSGVLASYVLDGFVPSTQQVTYVAATRNANVVQYYLNGVPVGAPSAALTPPTGGELSRLRVGGSTHYPFSIADLRVSNTARSAAQIKATYNAHYGSVLGVRP